MKLYAEPLALHTTLKIGGRVDVLAIPESESELIETVRECQHSGVPYRLLGNGSNILARDGRIAGVVIKCTRACRELRATGDMVEAGTSVKLQAFIQFCVRHNLEGMEFLYSVPGTIGGAICMNAGRGKRHQRDIAQRVVEVRVFDGSTVRVVSNAECSFGYRRSIFQMRRDWIILGARFRLERQPRAIGEQRIAERMAFTRQQQDWSYPSLGSIFRKGHPAIFWLLKGHRAGGARFSPKTKNWISNVDDGRASDVLRLIGRAKLLHALIARRAELEVEIW